MSGDMMPKEQYDFIKGIQDNMLEASNMTEADAWRFGFLLWQHQEWIRKYLADRKTEPQYSEDDMYWLSLAEDVANGKMSDAGANQAWLEYINHKDEPTISKMEQVDKDINVRSKDEPQYDFGEYADRLWKIAYERGKREALEQTEPSCDTCKLKDTTEWCKSQEVCRAYQPKDEPQTESE